MRMHEETFTMANELMGMCFEMNAVADNIGYNLADQYLLEAESIFHKSYAHMWPVIADAISEELLKLNARPTRLAIAACEERYDNVAQMMGVNQLAVNKICQKCKDLIELAEMMDDVEIKIFAEDLLSNTLTTYQKQADEWATVAAQVSAFDFDVHFDDYTHFISFED